MRFYNNSPPTVFNRLLVTICMGLEDSAFCLRTTPSLCMRALQTYTLRIANTVVFAAKTNSRRVPSVRSICAACSKPVHISNHGTNSV